MPESNMPMGRAASSAGLWREPVMVGAPRGAPVVFPTARGAVQTAARERRRAANDVGHEAQARR